MTFGEYQEACLYGTGGFFTTGGGAGRRADFLTSPSVGPLFGAAVARFINAEWERHGRPDQWVVVEAGSGDGILAEAVLMAMDGEPTLLCRAALRYVCVERSAELRGRAAERLRIESPSLVLGPRSLSGPVRGPRVTALAELPAEPFTGMVVTNELLDNLPLDLFEWRDGEWAEVRVAEERGSPVELLVAAAPDAALELSRLVAEPAAGSRVPLQRQAAAWLARVLGLVTRGRVVCADYCSATSVLAARPQAEWLRTYRGQGRGGHPLAAPGSQDITCEIAVDQLAHVRSPSVNRSQAEWLRANGLDELISQARAAWQAGATRPDLAALQARSRVSEAAALVDPEGMGAFRVLEWDMS